MQLFLTQNKSIFLARLLNFIDYARLKYLLYDLEQRLENLPGK